jgi:hypothetical protein
MLSRHSYGVTEQQRRAVAEELAKVVLARTADGQQTVPAAHLAETDDEVLSAEDLALQQAQFTQFAMDGTAQRPSSSRLEQS